MITNTYGIAKYTVIYNTYKIYYKLNICKV